MLAMAKFKRKGKRLQSKWGKILTHGIALKRLAIDRIIRK